MNVIKKMEERLNDIERSISMCIELADAQGGILEPHHRKGLERLEREREKLWRDIGKYKTDNPPLLKRIFG